jgi:hypothetical protein
VKIQILLKNFISEGSWKICRENPNFIKKISYLRVRGRSIMKIQILLKNFISEGSWKICHEN